MLSIHSLPSHFLPLPARRLREYISEHARAIRAHTRLDVDNALTSWTVQQVGVSAAQVTARVPQTLSLCLCMGVLQIRRTRSAALYNFVVNTSWLFSACSEPLYPGGEGLRITALLYCAVFLC